MIYTALALHYATIVLHANIIITLISDIIYL